MLVCMSLASSSNTIRSGAAGVCKLEAQHDTGMLQGVIPSVEHLWLDEIDLLLSRIPPLTQPGNPLFYRCMYEVLGSACSVNGTSRQHCGGNLLVVT